MKITDISTYCYCWECMENWVFTRVDTGEGLNDIGRCSMNGFAKMVETTEVEFKCFVIGRDPLIASMLR